MRVYKLAKELEYDTKSFLKELEKIGIKGKKHTNSLNEDEINLVRKNINKNNKNIDLEKEDTSINFNKSLEINLQKNNDLKENEDENSKVVKTKIVFVPEQNKNNDNKSYEKNNDYSRETNEKNNKRKSYLKNNHNKNKIGYKNFNINDRENTKMDKDNYQRGKDLKDNTKNRDNKIERKQFNREVNNRDNNYQNRNFRNNKNSNREHQNTNRNFDYKNDGERKEYSNNREFNRENNRDNRNNKNFIRDNRNNNRGNRENKDFNNKDGYRQNFRDRRSNDNRDFNKDSRDERDNRDNRNFDRKNNRDSRDSVNSIVTPSSEKPKSGRGKFDKKRYEKEKQQKEEERKLKELRSDFKKEDKKRKNKKKQEKEIKNEITRIDGDSLGMITINEEISVKELAEKLGINVSDIIKKFFMAGKMLTANAILTFEEAEEVALDYEVIVEKEEVEEVSYGEKYNLEIEDKEQDLVSRAPVITIMGHVDHGKTSLLDALRHTRVIEGEAGGITQRIGAYQVNWKGQKITFIDTPGHEAFTEMRARGANITDISILIVAADDGVKPQTVEAISHAKEAGVPIIVAINKIDKPGADPMRVRTELTEYGLMSPEWGGTTEFVEISAKQKINLEALLETILITAELEELKANPKKRPKAVVVESRLDPKMGAVADILVQEGELKVGDIFVAGESYGRVRSMLDDRYNKINKAIISQPVEITGFNVVPNAGDVLYGVNNDKQAKKIVEDFIKEKKANEQNKKKHISLESLSQELEEQQLKELKCIIRADSKGSVEALKESLLKLNNEKVMINIIQASAGAVTEGDVKLAEASNAIIIAFNVRPTTPARIESEKTGVEIRNYNVIYHLTEDIEKAMLGMLDPEFKEVYLGRIEVKQVFKISNVGNIAGSIVVDGKVVKNSKVRILRDGIIIFEGEIATLKRFKDDAKEVVMGQECGIQIKDFNDIKEGDIIESFIMEEIPR